MDEDSMDSYLALYLRLKGRAGSIWQVVQIVSCGAMIGSAGGYLIASNNQSPLHAATLSLFVVTSALFHALHLAPYIRHGPYTGSAALVFLLLVVMFTSPDSRRDLAQWMPLFLVCTSLVTAAIHETSWRPRLASCPPRRYFMDYDEDLEMGEFPAVFDDGNRSDDGRSSVFPRTEGWPPASARSSFHQSDMVRGIRGPSSRYCRSNYTTHTGSNLTLRSPSCPGPPAWRAHWSPTIRSFWERNHSPNQSDLGIDSDTGYDALGLSTLPPGTSALVLERGQDDGHATDDTIDDGTATDTLTSFPLQPYEPLLPPAFFMAH